VVIATDVENPLGLTPAAVPGQIVVQKGASIRLDGQLAVVRFEATGKPQRMVICLGKSLTAGQTAVRANISTELVEVALGPGGAKVLHGAVEGVQVTE
jgi:hypothetical protein